jgi:hypothetical protein
MNGTPEVQMSEGVQSASPIILTEKQKERRKIINKKYRDKHRDNINAYRRKFAAQRRQDPMFRLSSAISCLILQSLKGGAKDGWRKILGYGIDELRAHLEKQFEPWMNWDNYGLHGWHIDHIIPISVFNYQTVEDLDFKRCWALKNLRPLGAYDNYTKGAKLEKSFQPALLLKGI